MKLKTLWAGFVPNIADKIVREAADDAAVVLDKFGNIVAVNEKFIRIYDIPEDFSLVGKSFNKIMDTFNEGSLFGDAYSHTLETTENTVTLGFSNKYQNWLVARTHNYEDKYVVLLFNTITDSYKDSVFSSQYDFLTAIPNRAFFENDLKRLEINSPLYVLFDLRRFQLISETLGSYVGDEVLKETAKRIRSAISKNGLCYRIAGDQFMLIVPKSEEENLLENLQKKMAHSFNIKNHNFFMNYHLGIFHSTSDEYFKKALYYTELALNSGKSLKQKVTYFEPSMISHKETVKIERDLLEAIEHNTEQFIIKYQLQYSLEKEAVCGAEALIRWEHPDRGTVDVEKFLKVSQEIGVMALIDKIVFDKVVKDSEEFDFLDIHLPISVNLSPQGILNEKLQSHILSVLRQKKYNISFEITETEWIDAGKCQDFLEDIKSMGYEISIDDFGVGYSSFEYLLNYPTDFIKIDKKFIQDICNNKSNQTIVSNIIKMGKGLNVKLVAEGVETKEDVQWLREHGCHIIQGFYFFKPESKDVVLSYFEKNK